MRTAEPGQPLASASAESSQVRASTANPEPSNAPADAQSSHAKNAQPVQVTRSTRFPAFASRASTLPPSGQGTETPPWLVFTAAGVVAASSQPSVRSQMRRLSVSRPSSGRAA